MTPTGRAYIQSSRTPSRAPRRGDVWLARLDKARPVVILTRDPMGQLLHSLISAPVTSTVRGLSTEVRLTAADGLRRESVANLDNLQLVHRGRLLRRIGHVRPAVMDAICSALSIAVDCH